MRLLNELRTVTISETAGRRVEAVVRVRGVDLRDVEAQGLHVEQQEPMQVVVREADTVRWLNLPPKEGARTLAMFVAAPIAARVLARMLKARRSR
jgi:hypothetical protein